MSGARLAAALPLLVAAVVLAACGSSAPAPRPASSSSSGHTPPTLSGPACVVALSYGNVAFDRVPDTAADTGGGCGVATAVRILAGPTEFNRPVLVDCGLAKALADWDRAVVQPAAQLAFGQPVAKIHHYGGYVCRERRSGGRLSEHAYGRAIDIGAFELADGTVISVHRHWRISDARATFLRQVAGGACRHFHVVLGPDADSDHADHLHLDVGPWTLCDP